MREVGDVASFALLLFELRHEKTCLWGFQPGPTKTGLYIHRWLDASNFGFRQKRDCTIYVAKTKALIHYGNISVQK